MIDIIATDPRELKNVTQIGTPDSDERIYIEDAAYARIRMEEFQERRVFVLMGHTEHSDGAYTSFIEAVIPMPEIEFDRNTPVWTNAIWNSVFREIRQHYENLIVVGWALDLKGVVPKVTAELEAIHREHFGGVHQMLFLVNSADGEEYFYLNKNNHLYRKDGFYIYYRSQKKHVPQPEERMFLQIPDIQERKQKAQAAVQNGSGSLPVQLQLEQQEQETARSRRNRQQQEYSSRPRGRYRELLLSQPDPEIPTGRGFSGIVAILAVVVLAAAVVGTALSKNPEQADKVETFLTTLSRKATEAGITLLPPDDTETGTEQEKAAETSDGKRSGASKTGQKDKEDGGTVQKDGEDGEDTQDGQVTETVYIPVERIDGEIPAGD